MPLIALIGYVLLMGTFAFALVRAAKRMRAIPSFQQHFLNYQKNPRAYDWFDKYFLGFGILGGQSTRRSIDMLGDRLYSKWMHVSALILYVFAGFFLLSIIPMFIVFFLSLPWVSH